MILIVHNSENFGDIPAELLQPYKDSKKSNNNSTNIATKTTFTSVEKYNSFYNANKSVNNCNKTKLSEMMQLTKDFM